jgi:diadenosine tetraphosphatase ApaH/serine/threonine PP2A family protein phosphatase
LSVDVFLCHGTPQSDHVYFLEEVENGGTRAATASEVRERLGGRAERLILCGHSHIGRVVELGDGRSVANVGSVGLQAYESDWPQPHVVENGSPHARYGILDSVDLTIVEVAYDHERAAVRAESNGRPDWAVALRTGRMSY